MTKFARHDRDHARPGGTRGTHQDGHRLQPQGRVMLRFLVIRSTSIGSKQDADGMGNEKMTPAKQTTAPI